MEARLLTSAGSSKIEDGEVLDLEDFVHALEAQTAFAVEEVRDMGLFESSLFGEAESGQFTCIDAVPENFTEVILQDFELHWAEYSTGDSICLRGTF